MQKIIVKSVAEGVEKAKKVLYEKIDRGTVLFLSGGSSPKPLYQSLALEKKLYPGACALVDERYSSRLPSNSNESMLKRTGLLNHFTSRHIPFSSILQDELSREDTALAYDETVRKLLFNIPKSVAVMGLGADCHTAGIAPVSETTDTSLALRLREMAETYNFVDSYNDEKGSFGQRITLTFQALGMIDYFVLWVFGEGKRAALEKIFSPGDLSEMPGRFFNKPEIAAKTVLITDIQI